VRRFIYCSSTEAIRLVKNPSGDESSELNPQFECGRSKARAKRVENLSAEGLGVHDLRADRNVDDIAHQFPTSYAKGA